jgi:hypothetical protein
MWDDFELTDDVVTLTDRDWDRYLQSLSSDWDESQHPRASDGKFTSEGGSSSNAVAEKLRDKLEVTHDPYLTRFVLPDGTRLRFASGVYTHEESATELGTTLRQIHAAGIVRRVSTTAASVAGPITEQQARILVDDVSVNAETGSPSLDLDVLDASGEDLEWRQGIWQTRDMPVVATKTFDRPTVDAVRYWVNSKARKHLSEHWEDQPRDDHGRFAAMGHAGGVGEADRKIGAVLDVLRNKHGANYLDVLKKYLEQGYTTDEILHEHYHEIGTKVADWLKDWDDDYHKSAESTEKVKRAPFTMSHRYSMGWCVTCGVPRYDCAEWNEDDHPRDDNGRFATGDGSSPLGMRPSSDMVGSERRIADVVQHVVSAAKALDFPDSRITVVDKPPRSFDVGSMQFKEGGHFDPTTGEIELNARALANGLDEHVYAGLAAHEIAHAQFDVVSKAMEKEHDDLRDMATNPSRDAEYKFYFRHVSGTMKPGREAALMAKYPASAAFAKTWGDSYLIPSYDPSRSGDEPWKPADHRDEMVAEDGVTEYSRAYWQKSGYNARQAVNETLSEVARYDYQARRGMKWDGKVPSQKWQQFAQDIRDTYKKLVKRDA